MKPEITLEQCEDCNREEFCMLVNNDDDTTSYYCEDCITDYFAR